MPRLGNFVRPQASQLHLPGGKRQVPRRLGDVKQLLDRVGVNRQ
jgi:hypothetical protein